MCTCALMLELATLCCNMAYLLINPRLVTTAQSLMWCLLQKNYILKADCVHYYTCISLHSQVSSANLILLSHTLDRHLTATCTSCSTVLTKNFEATLQNLISIEKIITKTSRGLITCYIKFEVNLYQVTTSLNEHTLI